MYLNPLLTVDSYKCPQFKMYPEALIGLYSYLEARGGVYPSTVFFGLQYYLEEYLYWGFSLHDIDDAEYFWERHFGRTDVFDAEMWRQMHEDHGGNWPVKIKAVPEGSVVPVKNVLMTIENTDPKYPWVTNFLETLLMKVWYPITVATNSFYIKRDIRGFYEMSGSDFGSLDFACHDFGYRGVSSEETASIGAAAHLLSFRGTDTVAGIRLLEYYYGATEMPGFSIPATEHSVICSFGQDEEAAFRRLLEQFPEGVIACVSDSFDVFHAVDELWGNKLRDIVKSRKGRLVVRPDSGLPEVIVPRLLDSLALNFGYSYNDKYFKVLDPHVRVIQGDGMNLESINKLHRTLHAQGWAAENLVVGSGGALLQNFTRDTCKFAIKASEATVDGLRVPIAKNPVTDPGKRSKAGRLCLVKNEFGQFETKQANAATERDDELQVVFENGYLRNVQTLDDIRARVEEASNN